MNTGEEAKISISSVVYYRGVAVTITKRDPDISIRPLIEAQLKTIDWLLDEKEALPSWNAETNKQVAGVQTPGTPAAQPITNNIAMCPKCLSPLVSGVTKNGKKYQKCSTQKYDYMSKSTTGCDYVNWNV